MLTGDPFVEFDPFTYLLLYMFPQQGLNYLAIAQAIPYLLQAQPQVPTPPPPPNSLGE